MPGGPELGPQGDDLVVADVTDHLDAGSRSHDVDAQAEEDGPVRVEGARARDVGLLGQEEGDRRLPRRRLPRSAGSPSLDLRRVHRSGRRRPSDGRLRGGGIEATGVTVIYPTRLANGNGSRRCSHNHRRGAYRKRLRETSGSACFSYSRSDPREGWSGRRGSNSRPLPWQGRSAAAICWSRLLTLPHLPHSRAGSHEWHTVGDHNYRP
jgi:hypothetical protein